MASNYVHDRYLDAEERYEIFVVKAAERPHLLHWKADLGVACGKHEVRGPADGDSDDDSYDEKKVDDSRVPPSSRITSRSDRPTQPPPPLTDGCDLPGWRCERIAPCMNPAHGEDAVDIESPLGGVLNVGAGCSLMRRERQLPFVCASLCGAAKNDARDSRGECWWRSSRQRFYAPPPADRAAPVIEYEDAAKLIEWVEESERSENRRRKITTFSKEFEIENRPVKILGATEGWSAMPRYEHGIEGEGENLVAESNGTDNAWKDVGEISDLFSGGGKGGWTFANLLSRFGDVAFRFSDTHGEMMPLRTYAKYITNPEGLSDDSPLGIYDSEFGELDSPTSALLEEYSVPECFSPDLFNLAHGGEVDVSDGSVEKESDSTGTIAPRPPYRWILIGPERSGTGMHVDPLWTDAWVTVLQGRKRWLLFPPDTDHKSIGMADHEPQIPSSIWFRDRYDQVTSPSWPEKSRPVEVLQRPGETVYVPAGWPHLVLNLELTVAVTHNYASELGPSLERMWEEVARDELDFASRWYSGLRNCGRDDLVCMAPPDFVTKEFQVEKL